MQSRTEIPDKMMKDIQGIWVKAWSFTNPAAVTVKTGVKYAQINGIEKFF
jgi:hypothetical protein